MKKSVFLFFVIAVILGIILWGNCAVAFGVASPYAVIGDDVWMLSDSGEKLFLLPKTYYAKIDKMDENYYFVTFNGFSGKIPKQSVSVTGYDKDVADTRKVINISQIYSVFTEIKLKISLSSENNDTFAVPTSEPLTYVGSYKQGENLWYFVNYNGQYGYILSNYTDTAEMTFADFVPVGEKNDETPETVEEEQKEETDLVKILVISGVSLAVLILVVVIFIPRKNKKHKYYYS